MLRTWNEDGKEKDEWCLLLKIYYCLVGKKDIEPNNTSLSTMKVGKILILNLATGFPTGSWGQWSGWGHFFFFNLFYLFGCARS